MYRVFQSGSVAAYQNVSMIKMHYRIADTLDHCLEAFETGKREKQSDRPFLRLDIHNPMENVEESDDAKDSNESLSTHSSLDDDDTSPSNWEQLPKNA